jgi:hypothetical protein
LSNLIDRHPNFFSFSFLPLQVRVGIDDGEVLRNPKKGKPSKKKGKATKGTKGTKGTKEKKTLTQNPSKTKQKSEPNAAKAANAAAAAPPPPSPETVKPPKAKMPKAAQSSSHDAAPETGRADPPKPTPEAAAAATPPTPAAPTPAAPTPQAQATHIVERNPTPTESAVRRPRGRDDLRRGETELTVLERAERRREIAARWERHRRERSAASRGPVRLRVPIDVGGGPLGDLEVRDADCPGDLAREFAQAHDLPQATIDELEAALANGMRQRGVRAGTCVHDEELRRPVVLVMSINLSGDAVQVEGERKLQVRAGDDPVDLAEGFCERFSITFNTVPDLASTIEAKMIATGIRVGRGAGDIHRDKDEDGGDDDDFDDYVIE